MYDLYFFDYDPQTDDATIIILNHKKPDRSDFAWACLDMRSAEQVRALEGICRAKYATVDELAASPESWDAAVVLLPFPDALKPLDQAGLLVDLSQSDYLASRSNFESKVIGDMPNGVFSEDHRMLGLPWDPYLSARDDGRQVFIINAKSSRIDESLRYGEHFIRSIEFVQYLIEGDDSVLFHLSAEDAERLWNTGRLHPES